MVPNKNNNNIKSFFGRALDEAIVREHFEAGLEGGKKLRVKYGADPTAPDLHLGHAVVLRKLKELQDLGHHIVFIIGDFTARVGDPTGRLESRPALSEEEIKNNSKTYFEQVGKILDVKKTEIIYNSEWFSKEGWADVLKLAGKFTVQQVLERDDFSRRLKDGREVFVHEILYPLMQAYDSVRVKADVEIGGTDQKFNMLAGRDLQRKMNLPEQDVLTVPLLVGIDGVKKMSKSAGNYIALNDDPNAMFGKIMSIPDSLILHYAELAAFLPAETLEDIGRNLKSGKNPRDEKIKVAEAAAALYHGEKTGRAAAEEFIKVFSKKETPAEMPEIPANKNKMNILDLLALTKCFSSKSEAKRAVEQRGVELDGKVLADWREETEFKTGAVLKIGKKRFFKIKIN